MRTRASVAIYSTPEDAALIKAATLAIIAKLRHWCAVWMYSFTDIEYATALVAAQRRGVPVRVILDHSQMADHRMVVAAQALEEGGVAIRIGTSPRHALMHAKTLIGSGVIVTGSLNWSMIGPAETNHMIVIKSRALSSLYLQQFDELWTWIANHEPGWQPAISS